MIRVDLEQTGYLGLNEEIRCLGFKVNINIDGIVESIDYHYAICVVGLDGTVIQTRTLSKSYTDANRRLLFDNAGQPVMVNVLDEEGNPMLDGEGNNITEQATIGVIQYWLASLGNAYILPDLQITAEAIGITHKR